MAKLLSIMLTSLSISTNVLLGKDVCSHYDEKACVDPNVTKHGHYVNQWTVSTTGMAKEDVKQLIENNGFVYLKPIIDGADLYLVTNDGTPEKHAMPDQETIEKLMKLQNVNSVEQIHMFDTSDAVFSTKEVNEVEFQHLNPDEIVLNDGSENLKRIMSAMDDGKDPSAPQLSMTRPVSNNLYNDDDQNDDDNETIALPDYEDKVYVYEDNPI